MPVERSRARGWGGRGFGPFGSAWRPVLAGKNGRMMRAADADQNAGAYSSKSQYSLITGLLKLIRSSLLVSVNPAFW
jgi:hypothetical protein